MISVLIFFKLFARICHFVIPKYVHIINIRNFNPLRRPASNLSCFQKISYNADIKVTDSVSFTLTVRVHEKAQFKVAFRRCLNTGMGSLFWCPSIWNTPETICFPEKVILKPALSTRNTRISQCFLVLCLSMIDYN